ncbi:MAG: tyrosine--tRNA ligase [Gemmatimonadetes bacterium]|nr:tyrosine--tRNA ligase [Gemmatimonadota bacterium]
MTSVFDEFTWRGMVYDATPGAAAALAREKVTAYNGFDPSAKSLHVGNLVPIMGLVHLQRHGHSPIAIVGGGTGVVGDPGGREAERALLSREQIEENVEGIRAQLEPFLDFRAKANPARLIDNANWLGEVRLLDFLRDTGKHFTLNYMLAKESVRSRLDREAGMSFAEFSYMLLQAYDFLVLYERYGCTFQMGGSDQWGNILAGVDLIRRLHGPPPGVEGEGASRAHAVVYPLITAASGEKFGKSVGGAPTLDPEDTSPYRLYQFFLNTEDRDVVSYLKLFTLLDREQIGGLERAVAEEPAGREAQRRLAEDVTRRVHGEEGLSRAKRATEFLFGRGGALPSADDLEDILADAPSSEMPRLLFTGGGVALTAVISDAGMCSSAGEARRLVTQGGIYLNEVRVDDPRRKVGVADAVEGRLLVLRRGAKSYHLVRLVE